MNKREIIEFLYHNNIQIKFKYKNEKKYRIGYIKTFSLVTFTLLTEPITLYWMYHISNLSTPSTNRNLIKLICDVI